MAFAAVRPVRLGSRGLTVNPIASTTPQRPLSTAHSGKTSPICAKLFETHPPDEV
jgi:hypothetical protein